MLNDAMTVSERLSRASNTSDLTTTPERHADAFTLIAAAKTPRVIGRHLIALYGEWDSCAKPRRLLDHDISAVMAVLPRLPRALVYAHKVLDRWDAFELEQRRAQAVAVLNNERQRAVQQAFARLRSLPKVEAGLCDILNGKVKDPSRKVLAVLAWWLNRICPACNGTQFQLMPGTLKQSERACGGCKGTGEVELPCGHDGRLIEKAIEDCIERARRDIGNFRKDLHRSVR